MPASRSLIALLVGTVAFFALWLIALKPGGSGSGNNSSSQGLGQYQAAINKAHQAVGISNASNAASGNDGTGSGASTSTTAAASGGATSKSTSPTKPATTSATKSKPAPHLTARVGAHNPGTLARLSTVQSAMAKHKMVVMLFYNPTATDDQAVKQELGNVPTHRGRVVKLTIPLSEAANFTPVTQQVPVNFSPTLVLIGPHGQTDEIVGFSDQFEIAQRVDDGLASR